MSPNWESMAEFLASPVAHFCIAPWPGAQQTVPMDRDTLGQILQSLSPVYERPTSEKERAGIDKARAEATRARRSSTGITAKLRMEDADNQAEFGESYASPFNASGGRQVVRTGTDKKTGRKVIQYDDGSVEYAQ